MRADAWFRVTRAKARLCLSHALSHLWDGTFSSDHVASALLGSVPSSPNIECEAVLADGTAVACVISGLSYSFVTVCPLWWSRCLITSPFPDSAAARVVGKGCDRRVRDSQGVRSQCWRNGRRLFRSLSTNFACHIQSINEGTSSKQLSASILSTSTFPSTHPTHLNTGNALNLPLGRCTHTKAICTLQAVQIRHL